MKGPVPFGVTVKEKGEPWVTVSSAVTKVKAAALEVAVPEALLTMIE